MGFVGCGTRQRLSLRSVPFPQVTAFYYVMALLSVSFWHGLRREDSRDASRPPPTTHKKKEPRMARLLVCPQVFFLSCDKMSIAEAVRERVVAFYPLTYLRHHVTLLPAESAAASCWDITTGDK